MCPGSLFFGDEIEMLLNIAHYNTICLAGGSRKIIKLSPEFLDSSSLEPCIAAAAAGAGIRIYSGGGRVERHKFNIGTGQLQPHPRLYVTCWSDGFRPEEGLENTTHFYHN